MEKPGRAAIDVIAEIVPAVVRGFPWPKSMRWGEASRHPGALTWVRPLHSIVATFGPETEDPDIVPFLIPGVAVGDMTRGHRFLAPEPFSVRRLDDYVAKLEKAKVVLDAARRQEIILADAKNLAFAQGLALVEDAGLLAEVAGLTEWPVVLMGGFDEAFLDIPPEVIRTTIRNNQKCFVLTRADGTLAPRFILVANTEASDGGAAIVAGNERVIRARLSDAKFFYETDLKVPLDARLEKLKHIVFHEKLGTQYARVERIEKLARELAPLTGADPEKAARAARLCKADLVTEMVGEFPELQGLMGKYYALAQGEDASVAAACEEHYKPLGPSDRVPTDPVSVAVALADKIDTLVGFWSMMELPTGSKDPYALRRSVLGFTSLIEENDIHLHLRSLISSHLIQTLSTRKTFTTELYEALVEYEESTQGMNVIVALAKYADFHWTIDFDEKATMYPNVKFEDAAARDAWEAKILSRVRFVTDWASFGHWANSPAETTEKNAFHKAEIFIKNRAQEVADNLLSFFHDRLKVQLREQGARHDLVDAVLAPSSPTGEVGRPQPTGWGSRCRRSPHPGPAVRPSPEGRERRRSARRSGREYAGRSSPHRAARRGAREIPRNRRRQEPLGRRQARDQHLAHRGKEGRANV